MNENDFISGELEEVKLGDRVFKIKPLTGKENDEILDKNLKMDVDGKMSSSLVYMREQWIKRCVIDAPYELNGKPFKELTPDEKLGIIQKLKPYLRNTLLKELQKINDGTEEEKKTLNQQY